MPSPASPPPTPAALPAAPITPGAGVVNTLAPPGIVARLDADYDRTGALDTVDAEREVRLLRPGAIILPNLDISDPSLLPPATPPGSDRDLKPFLDMTDSIANGTLDESQLMVTKLTFPSGITSRAASIAVRIDAKDAARIRAFQIAKLGSLELAPTVVLGDGSREMAAGGLSLTGLTIELHFEAVTLAGDPTLTAPTGPSPAKPPSFKAKFPPGSSGAPAFAKRTPGDVWVELVHLDSAGKNLDKPRDVALFTIAPLLLLCGIQPAKRVFVVNIKDEVVSGQTRPGNQNFVFDLMEGCQAAFGVAAVPLPASTSAPPTPSTPASTAPFYLIDGDKTDSDPWIQDEMEVGYCFAPHASMHVVLHCKRNRGLHKFVHNELPASRVGLYDGLHAPDDQSDSVHYGGNIEATPPITAATPALGAGAAGPAVKAHKAAPFGKILLGDARRRKVDADFRKLLLAQRVQPVLPLDTSWLAVGHVDEFTSFVADGSAKGFKLLEASVNAMTLLLEETKKVSVAAGRTNFHRGKWHSFRKTNPLKYAELSVEDFLKAKKFNDTLRAATLIPIDKRLQSGLALGEKDIIRIPTYFDPPTVARPPAVPPARPSEDGTAALNVGMVNMLVVGKHLMIPKPFGPRVKVADAEAVLTRVFAKLKITASVATPTTGDVRWVEPGETVERMVCYYTDAPSAAERDEIVAHIKDPSRPLSVANAARVLARAAEIAAAPDNVSNGLLVTLLTSLVTGGLSAVPTPAFNVWLRIAVPDDKVDVIEAYMLSVLAPLGVTVHFVDDWFYHFQLGEAHCATNAIREMPEDTEAKRWWDKYDPSVDVDYSP